MNRTDRLLAIVLEIQARKRVRAEDLADRFEVSLRTIYRDMLALMESGVPIVSIPGQGYSLVEGYFLPPLTFSTDEAIMILLGTDVIAQNVDAEYRSAAQSASRKIVAVLSDQLRREVEYLQSSLQFITFNDLSTPQTLRQLRQAIIQCRTVRFRYQSRYRDDESDRETLREVDPYALIHIGGAWMLIAYCHLRRDRRHFRLSRMEDVVILEKSFTRPADFEIQLSNQDDRTVVVRALFDHETVRRVEEAPSLYQVAQEEHPDGLLVTLTVRQPADILSWLLSWGSHVRVLEPESLRELLTDEAEGILKNHQRY
ncbi:MAG: YafY family transcriptional regulator [Chloroflexi bacterium]|nr:YafY family transcriptional regulator [Chloroflexota bacterium]